MKYLKMMVLLMALTTIGASFQACGNNSETATEEQGKEYTSAYVCPMHCDGSGSEEAGTCPVCGMDYVKNEDHTEDGHEH